MFRISLLLFSLAMPSMSQSSPLKTCHSVVLTGRLSAGGRYEEAIGEDLVFRLDPERLGPNGQLNGWNISLVASRDENHDYIYPVNPPLRFNGLQILGPSYGDNTKASLDHPHEMRFVVDPADYRRIWPLVTNALWPYYAPNPDKVADEYFNMLKTLRTGQLMFTVTSYDADPGSGSIRYVSFRSEFRAPENFAFDPRLKPQEVECPAPAE